MEIDSKSLPTAEFAGKGGHPLFDAKWYHATNPHLPSERATFHHYLTEGWRRLKSPHPLFIVDYYFTQRPDVRRAGVEPLQHFIRQGWRDGASPCALFDVNYYMLQDPDLRGLDPLTHFLTFGSLEGLKPNPEFDPAFYLERHVDVLIAGDEPLTHYARVGHLEGRETRPATRLSSAASTSAKILLPSADENKSRALDPDYERLVRSAPTRGDARSTFVSAAKQDPRVIAFYLPQYHRVKENDEWWGEGFTEWTNVRKALPNFEGHYQPHVPKDNYYYDLDDVSVMVNQAKLAKEYGVTAFCYYLYWFDGRRVLEKPLDRMLATPAVDIEFCVCWANENWTRTWDGKANDILLAQSHSPESDRRFIRDAMKYLADPRYIRVDGKLMLLVYRADLIPNCADSMAIWRDEVRRAGLGELHLCAVQFYGITDPEPWGFDAAVEFPPHGWLVPEIKPDSPPKLLNDKFSGHIFDYSKAIDFALRKPIPDYRWYRGVFPGWDNTARRQDTPHIFANNHPFEFQRWCTELLQQTMLVAPSQHQILFINAWNEWGEGAHLEPDAKFDRQNLMALHASLEEVRQQDAIGSVLRRLRQAGTYAGREQDERTLLNFIKGQEQSLRELSSRLKLCV
ncbi:glycosyltransferase WbsX family protein [Methylocystis rosea]|nr:glycoside hydrolase family 99-like domain-containing protein [Methylocystis rosea]